MCYYLKSALSNLGGVHNAVILRLAGSQKNPNKQTEKPGKTTPKQTLKKIPYFLLSI